MTSPPVILFVVGVDLQETDRILCPDIPLVITTLV